MATCKDCIHHKVCSADRKNDKYFMLIGCVNVETNCIDFVGKSHFVEVVHGRWIDDGGLDEDGNGQYRCSCCGVGEKHNPTVTVSYCWNCGAKMDGDGNG